MIASVREVTVIASAIGPHVPNLGAVVTLFGVDGLLLFFYGVSSQKYGQIIINYDYNVHHLL